jgi:hypothetical protein
MQYSVTCGCLTDLGCLLLTVLSNLFTAGVIGFVVAQNYCSWPLYHIGYILCHICSDYERQFAYWPFKEALCSRVSVAYKGKFKPRNKLDKFKITTS